MGIEAKGLPGRVISVAVALTLATCMCGGFIEFVQKGAKENNTSEPKFLASLWLDIVSGPKNLEPVRNNAPDSPPVIVIPRESPTPTDILGSPKSPIDWMASQTPQP